MFIDINDRPRQTVREPHLVKQVGVDHIFEEGHNTSGIIFVQAFAFKQRDGLKRT